MKKFLNEFKEFAMRGNVLDMAVGIVVGSAFTKIVTSLVNDLIMPLIGLIPGASVASLNKVIGGTAEEPVILGLGNFIQCIIDFVLIAFCVFTVVKAINTMKAKLEKKKEEEPAPAPEVDERLETLKEIRDLLKNK